MEYHLSVGWGGSDAVSIITIIITALVLFMSVLVLVRRILGRTLRFRRRWWEPVVVSSKLKKIEDGNNKRVGDDDDLSSGGSRRRIRVEIPKGSVGWPLIGETLDFIACGYSSRPVSFMEKRKSQYGDVFKTHLLGKPVIVSTDPEVNKAVLLNHGNIFTPSYPKSITELFGETSILNIDGAAHRRLHACIGRFLRSPSLKARITRDIEDAVKVSLETWSGKSVVYVQDETKEVTFEILVKVLMSIGPGEDMDFLKREYREFIKGLICVPIKLPGTQLYKSLKAKKRLLEMVRRIVEKRKSSMEHQPTTNTSGEQTDTTVDAIEMLLRDYARTSNIDDPSNGDGGDDYQYHSTSNNQLFDQRLMLDFISGNIIEMMIPGEESVPMVMTLVVKFLGENPLALAKLTEENMELKRQKIRLSAAKYDWTDYLSLRFTQNVISETLRMTNIINAVWRQANKDFEIKGYLIPKGWCVLASFTSIHMDEHNYENPYDFDPWRWENKAAAISSNTFTPFGGGQRLCPGADLARLEIAIFLHHLVTTYRWVGETDEIVYFPTVKMKKKLPVIVTPLPDCLWS
uniref:22alpha-hydroxysteroid 23-monooxygenase n=1 Tax=Plumbago zeylanica TaxID=76149 RepID=A0A9E9M7I8_9CARY|nr:CYP90C42 [Plumbago zeylanica]